ncbi:RND family efflux transporter MFP subunit [Bradyrhizobium sp. LM6.11]
MFKRGSHSSFRRIRAMAILTALSPVLAACGRETAANDTPAPRIVRTTTVEKRKLTTPLTFSGRIEAEDEVNLAFRISGRLLNNDTRIGDRVKAGQVLARLESQNELNALRQAQASLAAAQGQLTQARNHFDRQETLLAQGWTTRVNYDAATQAQQTARSQVDAAEAALSAAHDLVGFTELKADAPGVITATGQGAGEVVQAGQMIARIARQDGRDAVFDVPSQLVRSASADPEVEVSLADDPTIKAKGRIREVGAQANAVTRTFEVRVGLTDPPPAMRLGATVVGRVSTSAGPMIDIPASALTRMNQRPAVWIVDPTASTVSVRNVDVLRFDEAQAVISQGLDTGEIVVTAGVQALHPGQKVPGSRIRAMSGVNLSDWALKSGSLVVYMMIIAVVAGGLFYFRLGRNEDPAFIIKTMVVQAAWPGASVEETMKQVTERLERRLQETPHLDFLRSFTRAGVSTVFVNLKGSASAREVTDTWYHVRKSIGDMRHTLPAGVIGPGFNDEFGDTFGIIYGFTSDGFSQRELRGPGRRYPLKAASRARRVEDRAPGRTGRGDLRRVLHEGACGTRSRPVRPYCGPPVAKHRTSGRNDTDERRQHLDTGIWRVSVGTGHRRHQFFRERTYASPERHRAGASRLHGPAPPDVSGQWEAGDRTRNRHAGRR